MAGKSRTKPRQPGKGEWVSFESKVTVQAKHTADPDLLDEAKQRFEVTLYWCDG